MKQAFVSSRVSTQWHQRLNQRIARVCRSHGLRPFLPQVELEGIEDAVGILEGNEAGVVASSLLIVVFDRPGAGVAMELAQALTLGVPVIGFRSGPGRRAHLGMMLEGAFARLPSHRQVQTMAELDVALARFVDEQEAAAR
ncbi:MAG: nucleoside 2-deoxyribosyltransferase [Sandaracinaceae bacterium]